MPKRAIESESPFDTRIIGVLASACVLACSSDATGPAENTVLPTPIISVGETTVCAAHEKTTMYCWGVSADLQFGEFVPGQIFVPDPRATALTGFAVFAKGPSGHMCVTSAAGIGTCWGRNSNGQVGNGSPGPGNALRSTVAGGIEWAEISIGRISTCGVSKSGNGYCWGSNFAGEIGAAAVPLATNTPTPTPVDGGFAFKSVVVGWRHACGITTAGAAYCWGENTRGQLGIGVADSVLRRSPVAVAGNHVFSQLTLGGRHTCGLTTAGQALCWGDNSTGQLGEGSAAARSLPTPVAGGLTFRSVATSGGFAGGAGVPLPNATQGGVAHTCALTNSGTPYCWGWSGAGQIGNQAATTFQVTPLAVSGGLKLDALQVGGAFTCGMRGNAVWCWGANSVGQLGNGGIANSPIPGPVSAPFNAP